MKNNKPHRIISVGIGHSTGSIEEGWNTIIYFDDSVMIEVLKRLFGERRGVNYAIGQLPHNVKVTRDRLASTLRFIRERNRGFNLDGRTGTRARVRGDLDLMYE